MSLVIGAADLNRALQLLKPFVSNRKQYLPILEHVVVQTTTDQSAQLCATDLESALTVTIHNVSGQLAPTCVPLKAFRKVIDKNTQAVTLQQDEQHIQVQFGGTKMQLPTMPFTEYPLVPTAATLLARFKAGELVNLIELVEYAAASEDNRPIFTGMYMVCADNQVRLECADTFRLAIATGPCVTSDLSAVKLLIPVQTMRRLAMVLKAFPNQCVSLYYDSSDSDAHKQSMPYRAEFIVGNAARLSTTLIEGVFIDTSHFKNTEVPITTELSTAAVQTVLLQIKGLGDLTHSILEVVIFPDHVVLQTHVGDTEACLLQTTVPATTDHLFANECPTTILLNTTFLVDWLKLVTTPTFRLQWASARMPIVLAADGRHTALWHLVMPLHARDGR